LRYILFMGEILHGMFNEVVGKDKATRGAARKPFAIASTDMTIRSWGAIAETTGAGFDFL
jgi:hypothetical protein